MLGGDEHFRSLHLCHVPCEEGREDGHADGEDGTDTYDEAVAYTLAKSRQVMVARVCRGRHDEGSLFLSMRGNVVSIETFCWWLSVPL